VAAVVVSIRYFANNRGSSAEDVWSRVDAWSYLQIAAHGYSYRATDEYPFVAWFPGYPVAIRALGNVVGSQVGAAVAISLVCGLSATVCFWVWTGSRLSPGARRMALAAWLLYAYGWYLYGTVYSDGMFLALALAAFVLVDRNRWWAAAVVAGAASGTRPVGLAVGCGLVVMLLVRDGILVGQGKGRISTAFALPARVDLRALGWRHLAYAVTACWGVLAYSAYLGRRFGDPLLWVGVQSHWSQGPAGGPLVWFKLSMAARMVRDPEAQYIASNLAQGVVLLAVLAVIPTICRRFGLGIGVYVMVLVAMMVFGANELVGLGRYAIGVFPGFAVLGGCLASRPALARGYLVLSAVALVGLTILFSRGAYLT
jgi:hypothetical protein